MQYNLVKLSYLAQKLQIRGQVPVLHRFVNIYCVFHREQQTENAHFLNSMLLNYLSPIHEFLYGSCHIQKVEIVVEFLCSKGTSVQCSGKPIYLFIFSDFAQWVENSYLHSYKFSRRFFKRSCCNNNNTNNLFII